MAEIQQAIGKHYPKQVIPLIHEAKSRIVVLMYEWKWYGHESAGGVQKLNLALVAAARRGVKVQALLNAESMGHAITKINTKTMNFLLRYGCKAKMGNFGGIVHAKMMIIDDEILVLGSHNYSKSAFSRNREASVIVKGREEIKAFRKYFDDIWEQFF